MNKNTFQRGTGCFSCKSCGHKTRAVGTGDAADCGLCQDCYELAGIYNAFQDGEDIQKYASEIQCHARSIQKKGGKLDGDFEELLSNINRSTDEETTMSSKTKTSKKAPAKGSAKKAPAKKAPAAPKAKKAAPAKKASAKTAAKTTYASMRDQHTGASKIESPVKLMWDLCDKMQASKRKDVIEAAVNAGISYYTARTQYQLWLTAFRNS